MSSGDAQVASSAPRVPAFEFHHHRPQQDLIGRAGNERTFAQTCGQTLACWHSRMPSGATSFLPFPTIFQRHRKVKFSSAIGKIQNPEKRALLPLVFQRVKFYHKYWKKEEHLRTESSLRHSQPGHLFTKTKPLSRLPS